MSKLKIKTNFKVKPSSDSGHGYVTYFERPKTFKSIEEAEELNYYDVKGALLSYDGSKYTAWNGGKDLDKRAWDYREDRSAYASITTKTNGSVFATSWTEDVVFPDTYGDVIAVCIGSGLWASTKWDPYNNDSGYPWCTENSPLYSKQQDCLQGTGWENTSKLVDRCQEGDLFAYVRDFGADDGTKGHWYVPSKFEIYHATCNLGDISEDPEPGYEDVSYRFLNNISNAVHQSDSEYWSSSQSTWPSASAYSLYNADLYYSNSKYGESHCTILLHFGEELY